MARTWLDCGLPWPLSYIKVSASVFAVRESRSQVRLLASVIDAYLPHVSKSHIRVRNIRRPHQRQKSASEILLTDSWHDD
jgi:hypothetical protein